MRLSGEGCGFKNWLCVLEGLFPERLPLTLNINKATNNNILLLYYYDYYLYEIQHRPPHRPQHRQSLLINYYYLYCKIRCTEYNNTGLHPTSQSILQVSYYIISWQRLFSLFCFVYQYQYQNPIRTDKVLNIILTIIYHHHDDNYEIIVCSY
jgi:hypothetical protein